MYELSEDALQKIGTLFVNMMKKKIKERIYPYGHPDEKGVGDKYASGNLYNTLTATVMDGKQGPELVITYADYFKYVNLGRAAGKKRVPIPAILDWIKIRGLKGRNKKGQFIPRLSFAFAIRENIYKYGIRPATIYDKGYNALEDIFENPPEELRQAYNELYAAIENDVANFVESNIREVEIEKITLGE
jgi:hypothetical protein